VPHGSDQAPASDDLRNDPGDPPDLYDDLGDPLDADGDLLALDDVVDMRDALPADGPLPCRPLGQTALRVTPLAFGTAPLGNMERTYGYTVDEDRAQATLRAILDSGVNLLDTAAMYGDGTAERRIGAAIADRGGLPDGFVVATKVDLDPATGDFSADQVRRSIERSLQRLGLDRLPIAYLHDPDDHGEQAFREGYPALERLRAEGVVGAIGAGMNQARMLTRFLTDTDADVVLCAGRYTLLEQPALAELLPLCAERGVGVVAAAPYNSGLLATDEPAADARYNYAAVPDDVLRRARDLAAACRRHGVPLPTAALAYPLRHPAVRSVVVGSARASSIRQNAERARTVIPEELWSGLRDEGLIP
jgi:D-threo-aldose 1-dehydrogenase